MTLLATLQAKTNDLYQVVEDRPTLGVSYVGGYLYTDAEHAAVLEKLKELEAPDTVDARLCPDCGKGFGFSFTEKRVTCGCKRQA